MTVTLRPGGRGGEVVVPSSKSQLHRLLLCAALGTERVRVEARGTNRDVEATAACLTGLGAGIRRPDEGVWEIEPIRKAAAGPCPLPCGESGSTLRFLLPVTGMLGAHGVFYRTGRLPERPLAPLDALLRAHGMTLREEGEELTAEGQLQSGCFELPGNVSSQYVSGLLMALPYLKGDSAVSVSGRMESEQYVAMTEQVLCLAQIRIDRRGQTFAVPGGQRGRLSGDLRAEGDWSSAAFFLCMGALSPYGIRVRGLDHASLQPDRDVLSILRRMGARISGEEDGVLICRGETEGTEIDASRSPDLVPALAAFAGACRGETRFTNAGRLRLKESDRLESTKELIEALGGEAEVTGDVLTVRGKGEYRGGTVDPRGDHRIAMAAAVAACAAREPVVVCSAECAAKSYPGFWQDLTKLKEERR